MDHKEKILSLIKCKLSIENFTCDDISKISNAIISVLQDYNITAKSTELAPLDQASNEILQMFAATLYTTGKIEKDHYVIFVDFEKISS